MKKALTKLAMVALLWSATAAQAQLVVVNDNYIVTRVDAGKNQFVVMAEGSTADDPSINGHFDVLISPKTRVTDGAGKPVDWRRLKPGNEVHVEGGLRLNVKIAADRVVVNSP